MSRNVYRLIDKRQFLLTCAYIEQSIQLANLLIESAKEAQEPVQIWRKADDGADGILKALSRLLKAEPLKVIEGNNECRQETEMLLRMGQLSLQDLDTSLSKLKEIRRSGKLVCPNTPLSGQEELINHIARKVHEAWGILHSLKKEIGMREE